MSFLDEFFKFIFKYPYYFCIKYFIIALSQSVNSVTWSCPTFATQWTAARQTSLSITNSQSFLKPMSIEPVMPFNHLILCRPLLLPHSIFPALGSFPRSQFFASDVQSIGVSASASVLPMNIQD